MQHFWVFFHGNENSRVVSLENNSSFIVNLKFHANPEKLHCGNPERWHKFLKYKLTLPSSVSSSDSYV